MLEFNNQTQVFKDREERMKGKTTRKLERKDYQHNEELRSIVYAIKSLKDQEALNM